MSAEIQDAVRQWIAKAEIDWSTARCGPIVVTAQFVVCDTDKLPSIWSGEPNLAEAKKVGGSAIARTTPCRIAGQSRLSVCMIGLSANQIVPG